MLAPSAWVEFDLAVAFAVAFDASMAGGGGGAWILLSLVNIFDTTSKRSCSSETINAGSSWRAFFSCSAPTVSSHALNSRACTQSSVPDQTTGKAVVREQGPTTRLTIHSRVICTSP